MEASAKKEYQVGACVSGKPTIVGTGHSPGWMNQNSSFVCFILLIAFDVYVFISLSNLVLNVYIFDVKS